MLQIIERDIGSFPSGHHHPAELEQLGVDENSIGEQWEHPPDGRATDRGCAVLENDGGFRGKCAETPCDDRWNG